MLLFKIMTRCIRNIINKRVLQSPLVILSQILLKKCRLSLLLFLLFFPGPRSETSAMICAAVSLLMLPLTARWSASCSVRRTSVDSADGVSRHSDGWYARWIADMLKEERGQEENIVGL